MKGFSTKEVPYINEFIEWKEDGNVHLFSDGYSTQDSQWRNRFESLAELYKYFVKEFING